MHEVEKVGLLVYTPEGYQRFLDMPMAVFDGLTARELLDAGETEKVLTVLAADYEGLGY